MALGMDNIIAPKRVGGTDTDFADKRRAEMRYQETQRRLALIEEGLQAINSRVDAILSQDGQMREQVQQWMMLVDGKIAKLMAQTAAAQDDRIPDLMARIARLETKRGPGRPPKQPQAAE